ncbi:DNA recombination protein RmuC [Gallaecimonas mangrovi]|uniref:DNA recombination protein RmuC n=1 Tax=Gallaecimonas mangrovi TaxID=2291597 RepID=UPI000E207FC5|nr:DNA recombination protein RmuC [Gallaecimonas mangrovi]
MTELQWLIAASTLAVLVLLLALALWQSRQRLQTMALELGSLQSRHEAQSERLDVLQAERDATLDTLEETRISLAQQQQSRAELQARLEEQQKAAADKVAALQDAEQRLSEQFQNLAQRIFEQKAEALSKQSNESLQSILTPLRQQLGDFHKKVDTVYDNERLQRQGLMNELQVLKDLNRQMSEETQNLTRALKGDKKLQGNWGEMVLNRVLEESGLRKGHEFDVQVALKDDAGERFIPDVVVHLPDSKDIIVDSKVSLVDYEKYFSAENDLQKEAALRGHVQALRQHIKGLGNKDYERLSGVNALDYVLMFIPIEGAFFAAMEADPNLFTEALQKNILVVSPTNLLVVLRTIKRVWSYEQQSRNAQDIASRAAALYEKFVGFVEDLEKVGAALDNTQKRYGEAMGKLASGRGNLVRQTEMLLELGVEPKKTLATELRQRSGTLDD